ncbi:MAG: hypothetical protein KAW12_23235 [Candidatus Aminicenantes bacterium]|nr:hypothetical protein [Candidatus Aminicenantes bacterium]
MKKSGLLILFLLLVLAAAHLTGESWIKQLDAGDQQLFYDAKTGTFLSLRPEFTIFDIKGKISKQGVFLRGNTAPIELQETIRLDDGTFFSLAFMYDEENTIVDLYKIIRFTREGEVLFVEAISLKPHIFHLRYLLQVGDKIKLVGFEDPGNQIGNIVVVTFSKEAKLLSARRLGMRPVDGRFFSLETALTAIDSDHYVIVKSGGVRVQGTIYQGIFVMKMSGSDVVENIIGYYDPLSLSDLYETPVFVKRTASVPGEEEPAGYLKNKTRFSSEFSWDFSSEEEDGGYTLLMLERKTELDGITRNRTPMLWKFTADWQLLWVRQFQSDAQISWNRDAHLLAGAAGYTIGLSKRITTTNAETGAEEILAEPVLVKTDLDGAVLWAREYDHSGPDGIFSLLSLNNGGMLMSTNSRYFYMLDGEGAVPGGCAVHRQVSMSGSGRSFLEKAVPAASVIPADIPVHMPNYHGFLREYDLSEGSAEEIFCQHFTLQGEYDSVIERSMFWGFNVHRVQFSVDAALAPYIAKFHLYRKFTGSAEDEESEEAEENEADYEFVTEITGVPGQTEYDIEFRPFVLGKEAYRYKIFAYNQEDELVDFASLSRK